MDKDVFTAAFDRLFEAAGCGTQLQLAELLGIRRSSISEAKRRQSIPPDWMLKLMRYSLTNPDWILTGQGARFMLPADSETMRPHLIYLTETKPPEECSAQELVNELVRRAMKTTARGVEF